MVRNHPEGDKVSHELRIDEGLVTLNMPTPVSVGSYVITLRWLSTMAERIDVTLEYKKDGK